MSRRPAPGPPGAPRARPGPGLRPWPLPLLIALLVSCGGPRQPPGGPVPLRARQPEPDAPWVDPSFHASTLAQVSQYIRRMFEDRDGNIWFGTNDDGAVRYDGKTLAWFTEKEGLAGRAVRGIVQDGGGNLWFATSGGVSRYDGRSFTSLTARDGLPHDDVWSMALDRSGTLWFGTPGGVARYDGRGFFRFPIPALDVDPGEFPTALRTPGLVRHILEDRAGNLWFATNGWGASRYDGRTFTTLTERDGLGSNFVGSILEDRAGTIWLGTSRGLCRYDGRSITALAATEGPGGASVWTMLEDRAGSLWLGTAGDALWRHAGGSFTRYSRAEGLGSDHVQSLLEDRGGILWVGTSGGVYRRVGGTFSNFTRAAAGR